MKQTIALVSLCLLLFGCHSTPKRIAFNSLATTAKSVDTAMSTAGALYRAGKVTTAQKDELLVKYRQYQAAANAALALVDFNYQAITTAAVADLAQVILDTVNQFTAAP